MQAVINMSMMAMTTTTKQFNIKAISTEIKLKPCPFCGGEPVVLQHQGLNLDGKDENINQGALSGLWYVGCEDDDYDKCEICPAACWYAKLSNAIEAWNKRK